jgi:hypothetical protein
MPLTLLELTDRPSLKPYRAKQHLDRLKDLQESKGSIVSSEARLPAEIEIDAFFPVGECKKCFAPGNKSKITTKTTLKDVNTEKMNSRLKDKSREDVMAESDHVSSKGDWLWLVNEFHDISKHRRLVAVN